MNITMPLYTPLAPDHQHDLVFEQPFAAAQTTVALRPLSLPGDWPSIAKWLFKEFARSASPTGHLPERHLRETFTTMLQCDFAQPFIGLVNQQPAFLIEICDGDTQCNGLDEALYEFEKGDHSIRLFLSPAVINKQPVRELVLFTCLHYFFRYPQVKRIIWEVHEKDKVYMHLANQLQFTTGEALGWSEIHVYLYPREKFLSFSHIRNQQIQKLP